MRKRNEILTTLYFQKTYLKKVHIGAIALILLMHHLKNTEYIARQHINLRPQHNRNLIEHCGIYRAVYI